MADRHNDGKMKWSLMPQRALGEMVKVLMHGANKYSDWNWATAPYFTRETFTDCMKRHQYEIEVEGDLYDDGEGGSGLLHSAHVACNALMQLHYDLNDLFDESTAGKDEGSESWEELTAYAALPTDLTQ